MPLRTPFTSVRTSWYLGSNTIFSRAACVSNFSTALGFAVLQERLKPQFRLNYPFFLLLLSITTFASGPQLIVEVLSSVAQRGKGGWTWYILNALEIYYEE